MKLRLLAINYIDHLELPVTSNGVTHKEFKWKRRRVRGEKEGKGKSERGWLEPSIHNHLLSERQPFLSFGYGYYKNTVIFKSIHTSDDQIAEYNCINQNGKRD